MAPGQEAAHDYAVTELEELALQLGNRKDIEVVDLDLSKPLQGAQDVHRAIYHKSLSYYFTRDLAHIDKVSEIFKEIVSEGERYSAEEYLEALNQQELLIDTIDEAMSGVDAFLTLSTAGEAPAIGIAEPSDTSLTWTLCGAPSITLPTFTSSRGRPFGAQIVARRYFDYALLDLAESVFPGDCVLAPSKPHEAASVQASTMGHDI
jgi:Asp-tRNA(Asn)/Glu-tRNA(Gln) amidotransferase A subunit family amidase